MYNMASMRRTTIDVHKLREVRASDNGQDDCEDMTREKYSNVDKTNLEQFIANDKAQYQVNTAARDAQAKRELS